MNSEALTALLRTYDASLDANSVKALYEDEDRRVTIESWSRLHLTPDTLISVDELEQYTALEKSGRAEILSEPAKLEDALPCSDREIREAIESLNRSTESISKQAELLRQQQDALGRLVKGIQKDDASRSDLESKHGQKREAGQKALAWTVEELSQQLHLRVAELEQESGTGASIRETVESLLSSDDILLSSLQKLGWELETQDPQEQASLKRLRETCARLIKCSVETIRTKLDRVYLKALQSSQDLTKDPNYESEDISAVQEELESLYAEILPVAQMSVEQQYLEPALKGVAARTGNSVLRSEQGVGYIQDCLDYLLGHMDALEKRANDFQAHAAATLTLTGIAKNELSARIEPVRKRDRRSTVGASPVRRRKSSGPTSATSPSRPRANSKSQRRYSGFGGDDPPLEELLRHMALVLPDLETAPEADAHAKVASLASTLLDRKSKVRGVADNVQRSLEGATASQMADASLALQMIRDSVLAESPFGEISLVDSEMDSSIAVTAQQLEDIGRSLDACAKDLPKARGRSVKRDELIRRWGL